MRVFAWGGVAGGGALGFLGAWGWGWGWGWGEGGGGRGRFSFEVRAG